MSPICLEHAEEMVASGILTHRLPALLLPVHVGIPIPEHEAEDGLHETHLRLWNCDRQRHGADSSRQDPAETMDRSGRQWIWGLPVAVNASLEGHRAFHHVLFQGCSCHPRREFAVCSWLSPASTPVHSQAGNPLMFRLPLCRSSDNSHAHVLVHAYRACTSGQLKGQNGFMELPHAHHLKTGRHHSCTRLGGGACSKGP